MQRIFVKQLIAIRSKIPWRDEMDHRPPKGTKNGHYFGLQGHSGDMNTWGSKFGIVKLREFAEEGGVIYAQDFRNPNWKEVDIEELLNTPKNMLVELYLEPTNNVTSQMVEKAVKIGNKYAYAGKREKDKYDKFPRLKPHKCKQCGDTFANGEDARQSRALCPECRKDI